MTLETTKPTLSKQIGHYRSTGILADDKTITMRGEIVEEVGKAELQALIASQPPRTRIVIQHRVTVEITKPEPE